jgi:hypothetical protein
MFFILLVMLFKNLNYRLRKTNKKMSGEKIRIFQLQCHFLDFSVNGCFSHQSANTYESVRLLVLSHFLYADSATLNALSA